MKPNADSELTHVVCVDDSKDILDLLLATLCRIPGVHCDKGFVDGFSLLDYLEAHEDDLPDVVVVDWSMPQLDGETLCRTIHERWPDIQIIVFSSHPREMVWPRAMQVGAAQMVEKSEGIQGLVHAIGV